MIRTVLHKKWVEWALVCIAAAAVGMVSTAPYYLAERSLGANYQGMPMLAQDSEGEYLARVHELTEGHYSLGSPVFYEYKQWPALVPPVGEWVYAAPTIFGMSVASVDMLYKFLLPIFIVAIINHF